MKSTNTSKSSNASSIDRSPPPTVFPGGSSIAVALNPSSGDGGWTNRDVAGVEERFREAGWEVEGFIGVSLFERLPDLFKKHDAVVVGGGDGTILAAAEEAMAADKPLGVLPMGTMNLFARDLGSPKDIVETADKLARGGIKSVDVAYMNDRLFLNNVLDFSANDLIDLRDLNLANKQVEFSFVSELSNISSFDTFFADASVQVFQGSQLNFGQEPLTTFILVDGDNDGALTDADIGFRVLAVEFPGSSAFVQQFQLTEDSFLL